MFYNGNRHANFSDFMHGIYIFMKRIAVMTADRATWKEKTPFFSIQSIQNLGGKDAAYGDKEEKLFGFRGLFYFLFINSR